MPNYKIFETEQYQRDLSDISANVQQRLIQKISSYVYHQLADNPHYGSNIKKLKSYSPETWRYRIGNFRMFYEIEEKEKIVFIIGIDLRKDAY